MDTASREGSEEETAVGTTAHFSEWLNESGTPGTAGNITHARLGFKWLRPSETGWQFLKN